MAMQQCEDSQSKLQDILSYNNFKSTTLVAPCSMVSTTFSCELYRVLAIDTRSFCYIDTSQITFGQSLFSLGKVLCTELLRNEYETYGWIQKEVILWSLQVDKKGKKSFQA